MYQAYTRIVYKAVKNYVQFCPEKLFNWRQAVEKI
jgi:hypothetical protein